MTTAHKLLLRVAIILALVGLASGVLLFSSNQRPAVISEVAGCYGAEQGHEVVLRIDKNGGMIGAGVKTSIQVIRDNQGYAIKPTVQVIAADASARSIIKGNRMPTLLRLNENFTILNVPISGTPEEYARLTKRSCT